MAKYKILEEFVLNGIVQKKDSIVELEHKMASLSSIQANIRLATPEDMPPSETGTVLSEVIPGQQLTDEQKKKLAEENERITAEAHNQAHERQQQDMQAGEGAPAVQVVADALKDKLMNEEFENKPEVENTPQA